MACPAAGTTLRTCIGGETDRADYDALSNATCAGGLRGAYCELCIDKWHYLDTADASCQPCGASLGYSVAMAVLAATAALVLYTRWRRVSKALRPLAVFAERVSFRAKLRNAISFYQIVTQLGAVYALRYPPAYTRLLNAFSIANLHLFNWLPGLSPVCLGLPSLAAQLWFAALVPFGVALAAFPVAKLISRSSATAALPFVVGWTFLLFPTIASHGFRALAPCDTFTYVDGGEIAFLRSDYAVECTGSLFGRPSAPSTVLLPAWVAVALWATGVPLLYAGLLRNASGLRGSLGLLVDDYRPEAAAWELAAVGEKLVLVGFLSLFDPGQSKQIFVAVLVAQCTLLLQVYIAPFRRASDKLFGFLSASMLVLVLIGSNELQDERLTSGLDIGSSFVVVTLLVATLSVLLVAVTFFACELRAARAPAFLLVETKEPPALDLGMGKKWHLFLSHQWDNQDAVAVVKRQLLLLLPGVRVFVSAEEELNTGARLTPDSALQPSPQLDVDDLESIEALEMHVQKSAAVLVLLGSAKYFQSTNCKRELAAVKDASLPLILLHDSDPVKYGSSLQHLQDACPEEFRDFVFSAEEFQRPVIPWHRVRDFQLVSLKLIAEAVLAASPAYCDQTSPSLYLPGETSRCSLVFPAPVRVWVSEANEGASRVVEELTTVFSSLSSVAAPSYLQPPPLADSATAAGSARFESLDSDMVMLLYLNERTFSNPRLADEVRRVWARDGKIVLAHENDPDEGGCAFDHFFSVTPQDLIDGQLFGPVAVVLHPGERFRTVSIRLLAVAFGARNGGDQGPGVVEMTVKIWDHISRRKSSRRSALADEDDNVAQLEMKEVGDAPSARI
jgi:hypothetical protein